MTCFLIQKQYHEAIFYFYFFFLMFFSTRIVKYFCAARNIFCVSVMMAHDSERKLVFGFVCMQKVKPYFVETHHLYFFEFQNDL